MIKRGSSPYDGFKCDRRRLAALISRDIRFVVIGVCATLAGGSSTVLRTVLHHLGM